MNVLNDAVDKDTIHTIVPIDLINDVTNDKLKAAIASKDIEYKNKILELMVDQFVKNKDIHSLGSALKNPYEQIITDAKADTFFVDAASYLNYEKNVKLLQNTLNSYSSYLVVPEYNTYLSTKEVEVNNQSINDILARYQSAQNELDSINSATPVMPQQSSDYQAYNANAKYFSKDKIDAKINSIDELYRNKVNDEIARLNNLKTLVETKWNNQNFNLNNVTNRITDLSNVATKKAYEIKSVLDRDPNLYQNTLKDLYKDVQNKMNSIMSNIDSLKNYKNEWAGVATWNNNVDIDLAKAERDKIVNYYNTNGIDTKYNIYKSQNNQPVIADCQNIIDFYNIVNAKNNQYKDIYANAKYDLLRKLTQGYYESNFYANKIKDYTQENMYKTNELYDLLIDNNNRGNKKALEEIKPIITNREVDKYNDMLVKYFNEKVDGGSFNQNSLLADNKDKIYDFVNKTSYIAELYNLNGTRSTAQEKEMLYNQSIQKYVSIKTVYNWINSQKDFNIKDAL